MIYSGMSLPRRDIFFFQTQINNPSIQDNPDATITCPVENGRLCPPIFNNFPMDGEHRYNDPDLVPVDVMYSINSFRVLTPSYVHTHGPTKITDSPNTLCE